MSIEVFALWLLAVIFVSSGMLKLLSLQDFKKTLEHLRLPVNRLAGAPAILCIVEIAAGIGLVFPWSRLYSQVAIFIMLLGFAWSVYQAKVVQKQDISCSCFGSLSSETLGMNTVVKIVLLALLNMFIMWANPQSINLILLPVEDIILSLLSSIGILMISMLSLNYYSLHQMQLEKESL